MGVSAVVWPKAFDREECERKVDAARHRSPGRLEGKDQRKGGEVVGIEVKQPVEKETNEAQEIWAIVEVMGLGRAQAERQERIGKLLAQTGVIPKATKRP